MSGSKRLTRRRPICRSDLVEKPRLRAANGRGLWQGIRAPSADRKLRQFRRIASQATEPWRRSGSGMEEPRAVLYRLGGMPVHGEVDAGQCVKNGQVNRLGVS